MLLVVLILFNLSQRTSLKTTLCDGSFLYKDYYYYYFSYFMHVQMSRVSSNLKNDIRLYPPTQIFLGLRYTPPSPRAHSFVVNLSATPSSECQFTYQKGSSHSFLSLPFKKKKDITEYSFLYLNTFSSNNANKKPCTIVKMILFSVYVTSRPMSLDHTVTKCILILTSIHWGQ